MRAKLDRLAGSPRRHGGDDAAMLGLTFVAPRFSEARYLSLLSSARSRTSSSPHRKAGRDPCGRCTTSCPGLHWPTPAYCVPHIAYLGGFVYLADLGGTYVFATQLSKITALLTCAL